MKLNDINKSELNDATINHIKIDIFNNVSKYNRHKLLIYFHDPIHDTAEYFYDDYSTLLEDLTRMMGLYE